MTHLLHIDTSGPISVIALARDGTTIAIRINDQERDHASSINRMVAEIMSETGLLLRQIDAIVVCAGPGSYTGLRIGLATAKGYSYAYSKPLILHDRLQLLAQQGLADDYNKDYGIGLLPARTGEYYIIIIDRNNNVVLPSSHHNTSEIVDFINKMTSEAVITGDWNDDLLIAQESAYHLFVKDKVLNTAYWSKTALLDYENKKFSDIANATPFYLKSVFIAKKA